jgi:hypothetical protein
MPYLLCIDSYVNGIKCFNAKLGEVVGFGVCIVATAVLIVSISAVITFGCL